MQRLLVFESLWGMQRLKGRDADLPLADMVAEAAAAGFDGVTNLFFTKELAAPLAQAASDNGIQVEGQCFPTSIEELKPALELANHYGIHHLTIQPDIRPRALAESLRILEGWNRMAEESDVPVYVETHRGRITNDLLVTLDILDAMPELRLLADLSHFMVGREFPEVPVPKEMDEQIRQVLDHSWAAHGRVASPEQVQVEISFAHNKPYLDQFLAWWGYLFESWSRRAGPNDTISFTCELGPKPYAISGPDGFDQSDRWAEALLLKDLVRGLWEQNAARR
ncbi:sugar phosphate isomerase/epimerase family protein [Kaistia nematophila]|uniref:TIM barrel protein n=1 Tax=Kaistia nematophila TaxID=2994654 RepID=A0A9X3IL75_9HYPH|nr:TIM barrel protein [Kaistia nematophila]MCX5569567.1 TIM barrel protein [Kaistia nematophila]